MWNRQTLFFGQIIRRKTVGNWMKTGQISSRRCQVRQREKTLDAPWRWHRGMSSLELIWDTRDCVIWRHMNVSVIWHCSWWWVHTGKQKIICHFCNCINYYAAMTLDSKQVWLTTMLHQLQMVSKCINYCAAMAPDGEQVYQLLCCNCSRQ